MLTLETIEIDKIYDITNDVLNLMEIKKSGLNAAYYDGRLIIIDRNHIIGSEIIRFAKRPKHRFVYKRQELIEMTPGLTEEILDIELSKYRKKYVDIITGDIASTIYHKITIGYKRNVPENKIETSGPVQKLPKEDGWSQRH